MWRVIRWHPTRKTGTITTCNRLVLSSKSIEPKYKILLYAFHVGDAMPITTWNADTTRLQVTNGAQAETIACLPDADGRTRLQITRAAATFQLN